MEVKGLLLLLNVLAKKAPLCGPEATSIPPGEEVNNIPVEFATSVVATVHEKEAL